MIGLIEQRMARRMVYDSSITHQIYSWAFPTYCSNTSILGPCRTMFLRHVLDFAVGYTKLIGRGTFRGLASDSQGQEVGTHIICFLKCHSKAPATFKSTYLTIYHRSAKEEEI